MSLEPDRRCPCGTGLVYGECCAGRHTGEHPAPTAEALMRSRYTAFVAGDGDYLLASWHPSTRPESIEPDAEIVWRRLDIEATALGGPFDDHGTVEFTAHYRVDGERGAQHEVSEFVREGGRWYYLRDAG